jgi:hypothetical protein
MARSLTLHPTQMAQRIVVGASLCAFVACTETAAPSATAPAASAPLDAEAFRRRAQQALVCVEQGRAPAAWQSPKKLEPKLPGDLLLDLRPASLLDHPELASALYRQDSGALYLVLHGGLANEFRAFGPLPADPRCEASAAQPSKARSPASSSTGTPSS